MTGTPEDKREIPSYHRKRMANDTFGMVMILGFVVGMILTKTCGFNVGILGTLATIFFFIIIHDLLRDAADRIIRGS